MTILTTKQRKFCDEYIISGNATEAAVKAGYSPKTAKQIGNKLLTLVDLRDYIDAELERMHSEKIADADEIMRYLTSVVRGESESEVVVTELIGDGCSEARCMKKAPDEKERLKAAELLGKRYGMFDKGADESTAAALEKVAQLLGGIKSAF